MPNPDSFFHDKSIGIKCRGAREVSGEKMVECSKILARFLIAFTENKSQLECSIIYTQS